MATVRSSDGVNLSYQVRGDGPLAVMFIHGWAGLGSTYDAVLEKLDMRGLKAIVPDLRGHGSSPATTGFTTEQFTSDLLAVADHAGAKRFITVAFSMSGKWAQYLAAHHPDRVIGQVLVSPIPAFAMPAPPEAIAMMNACAENREVLRNFMGHTTKGPLPGPVMEKFLDDAMKVPKLTIEKTNDMVTGKPVFLEKMKDFKGPTLVVGGVADATMPVPFLNEFVVAPNPGARLALIDCGHMVFHEAPAAMASVLQAFIAGARLA